MRLELAKTTPKKKQRLTLKKRRVKEGQDRIKWSEAHGHDIYLVAVMLNKRHVTLVMG